MPEKNSYQTLLNLYLAYNTELLRLHEQHGRVPDTADVRRIEAKIEQLRPRIPAEIRVEAMYRFAPEYWQFGNN